MKIGQAAKKSSLTTKTVRYYANIGLFYPEVDPSTGYRKYKQADVAKLQFVGTASQPPIWSIMSDGHLQGQKSPHSPQIENKYLAYKPLSQLRVII
ncbi:MerR family transcriptional regulator [Candidatus Ponderosibacter sp. Uisw_141_02]|jgi:hypothetical protein|uniref:MerR family transcriptional regulator n=1 Tax=Candidatus Ponderosibacter sp. Uisw_141_02 TaxID=3231000 RepID=UPI003D443B5D